MIHQFRSEIIPICSMIDIMKIYSIRNVNYKLLVLTASSHELFALCFNNRILFPEILF